MFYVLVFAITLTPVAVTAKAAIHKAKNFLFMANPPYLKIYFDFITFGNILAILTS